MTAKKGAFPSVKDLAKKIAEEKRAMKQSELPVRILVMPRSWALMTGEFVEISKPDITVATTTFVLTPSTVALELARQVMAALKLDYERRPPPIEPEPPLRPSEVPPALQVDEDDPSIHPLVAEAIEARKLKDTDWEPPSHLYRDEDDD